MQAIIWLDKKIRCAGAEIEIIVADLISSSDSEAIVKLDSAGNMLFVKYHSMITTDNASDILCIITNADGDLIAGAADIRQS